MSRAKTRLLIALVAFALAWGIVLSVSLLVYFREKPTFDWRAWWREHRAGMITVEVICALVLLGWSIFRATQNEIFTGEKPMDGAMMSAIMQTQTFPPEDPWASGYPISYYHFTYLIGAMQDAGTSLSGAMLRCVASAAVAVLILLWLGPETRGKSLDS